VGCRHNDARQFAQMKNIITARAADRSIDPPKAIEANVFPPLTSLFPPSTHYIPSPPFPSLALHPFP